MKTLNTSQRKAVEFIHERKRCALMLPLGYGKTMIALTAASEAIALGESSKVLVIAPLRVARHVWAQEAAAWAHLNHLHISICLDSAKDRRRALTREADVYVINRENVSWLDQAIGRGPWPWDTIILDESTSFKASTSKRWRVAKKFCHRPEVNRVILLTGTPMPNGHEDLWSQYFLLDRGERLESTKTRFYEKYYHPRDPYRFTRQIKDGSAEAIEDRIRDITLTGEAMPDTTQGLRIAPVRVSLSPEVMRKYKKFQRDLVMDNISAVSAGVLVNKLLQMANGRIYKDEDGILDVHDAKERALKDLAQDNPGENMLVAYSYRHDLDAIKKAIPHARVFDDSAVAAWNRGEIRCLVVHPAACGHGLNLQHGGSLLVWYGLTWNLEHWLQTIGRLHRQGQKNLVRVAPILAEGTVDDLVYERLVSKESRQDNMLENLIREVII